MKLSLFDSTNTIDNAVALTVLRDKDAAWEAQGPLGSEL